MLMSRVREREHDTLIDWFCWLLILVGVLFASGSRFLRRRIGFPAAAWLIVGAVIALVGLMRLHF